MYSAAESKWHTCGTLELTRGTFLAASQAPSLADIPVEELLLVVGNRSLAILPVLVDQGYAGKSFLQPESLGHQTVLKVLQLILEA